MLLESCQFTHRGRHYIAELIQHLHDVYSVEIHELSENKREKVRIVFAEDSGEEGSYERYDSICENPYHYV